MTLERVAWISVALFVVHEFEEIVFIHPWLIRHRDDPRASQQVFWGLMDVSTSAVAALIFEEIVLFAGIAVWAVCWDSPALLVGFLIPYTLHLVGHVAEAVRLWMLTPSVVTATLTLPWFIWVVVALITRSENVVSVLVWTLVWTLAIAANFALIARVQPVVDRYTKGLPVAAETTDVAAPDDDVQRSPGPGTAEPPR